MPLLQDDKDSEEEEPYEFEEGQEAVAKLLHLVYHKTNIDLYYEILMKFKRVFVKGGIKRMKHSLPALIFSLFKLSMELINRPEQHEDEQIEEAKGDEDEPQIKLVKVDQHKIFKQVHELIQLVQQQYPELTLRLYLQATEAINRIPNYQELEELAYEFMSQSLIIYQEELGDSEAKFAAINLILATLYNLVCFGHENYDTLVSNAVSCCSKLLKKPSQCEALTFASNLYFNPY